MNSICSGDVSISENDKKMLYYEPDVDVVERIIP